MHSCRMLLSCPWPERAGGDQLGHLQSGAGGDWGAPGPSAQPFQHPCLPQPLSTRGPTNPWAFPWNPSPCPSRFLSGPTADTPGDLGDSPWMSSEVASVSICDSISNSAGSTPCAEVQASFLPPLQLELPAQKHDSRCRPLQSASAAPRGAPSCPWLKAGQGTGAWTPAALGGTEAWPRGRPEGRAGGARERWATGMAGHPHAP
jgi:hypothetical protein